jgi:hypothetical protein
MGRGEYRSVYPSDGRGMPVRRSFASGHGWPLWVGRELSDEEVREATEAGKQAAASLIDAHTQLMRAWDPSKPLSREQMTAIMGEALSVAREVEKNLVTAISKVPSYWEALLRREGGLVQLRQGIDDAPRFTALIAKVTVPTVVPEFRAWIDHLFGRSESAVIAIGAAQNILPDWLRMKDILARLHSGAIAAINGILSLGGAAVRAVESLPTMVKVAGIAALVIGGVFVVSKLSSTSQAPKAA